MARRRKSYEVESIVEQFRELRSDYDAAKQTRFKRQRSGIVASGSGSDYHYRTWHAYATIMETARDLFRNHALVGQGIRRLVANILRGGFTLNVSTGDKTLDDELAARWSEWSEDPESCDRQGELCFHDLERLALQHVIVDGDVIPLPTQDGSLQLIEAHRLRTPTNTSRNVVHGVLLDDYRRRLEYWISKEDISPLAPLALVGQVTRYPARAIDELTGREERQVLHLYMPDRISQTRGITALVPVVDTAGMGDDLMFAQLVKAQMAACVTILRQVKDPNAIAPLAGGQGMEIEEEARPDGTIRQIVGWQPGMEIFGYPGEELEGFSPNVPNAEFFNHANLILSIVAVNLDLPLAVLMLDPSNTNFSGWRGAMDQARQRFQVIQRWLIEAFHTPVYRWKVRQWAAEDPAIRRAVEHSVRRRKIGTDGVDAFGHAWHAQEWPYIEPTQDALGDVIQDRNLLTSRRRLRARRGLDNEQVDAEIVEDRGALIRKGQLKAQELNKEFGSEPGWQPLTWKDVVHWPMPEGVTASVGQAKPAAERPQPNGQPTNRLAGGINGHAQ